MARRGSGPSTRPSQPNANLQGNGWESQSIAARFIKKGEELHCRYWEFFFDRGGQWPECCCDAGDRCVGGATGTFVTLPEKVQRKLLEENERQLVEVGYGRFTKYVRKKARERLGIVSGGERTKAEDREDHEGVEGRGDRF